MKKLILMLSVVVLFTGLDSNAKLTKKGHVTLIKHDNPVPPTKLVGAGVAVKKVYCNDFDGDEAKCKSPCKWHAETKGCDGPAGPVSMPD